MTNVFDVLKERGFIEQTTHEEEIRELLGKESVTFYVGFDPTADSLHVGHFVQVMVMMHMQQHGHRPIALMGGGTAMVGDPTGKTELRTMLSKEKIDSNSRAIIEQISKYVNFGDGKGIAADNADWLRNLNYVEFLRDVGKHFSVNKMLTAECFKTRMEKGLSFLEFNYMLMQSYDFFELYKRHNCRLQLGGNDQWSNIINGIDLIRRKESETVYGLTFKLLTTSEGRKMGKTEAGAVWIDSDKTSPYDLYQYLRNIEDADVENTLALLTFLPMDEVQRLGSLEGAEINKAKEVLAFEFTKIVHGDAEAKKAQEAARALFETGGIDADSIPSTEMTKSNFESDGLGVLILFKEAGLTSSNSEGMRLIKQGGMYVNDERIEDPKTMVTLTDFANDTLMLRKGKKVYHQIKLI